MPKKITLAGITGGGLFGLKNMDSAHFSSIESNPRIVRVALTANQVSDFLQETALIRSKLACKYHKAVLCMQAAWLEIMGKEGVGELRTVLRDRARGAIMISLPENLEETEYLKLLCGFSTNVINPKVDAATSSLFGERRSIHPRPGDSENKAKSMASPYYYEVLHTDGPPAPMMRDEAVMLVIAKRQHARGGESLLLHIDDWADCDSLSQRTAQEFTISLQKSATFEEASSNNALPESEFKTKIFFDSEFGKSVYFPAGYFRPENDFQAEYIAAFEQSLHRAVTDGTCTALPGPAGTIFAMNNYFWFHGRLPFQHDEKIERVLYRTRGALLPCEDSRSSSVDEVITHPRAA